jgi:hypothetical protein
LVHRNGYILPKSNLIQEQLRVTSYECFAS